MYDIDDIMEANFRADGINHLATAIAMLDGIADPVRLTQAANAIADVILTLGEESDVYDEDNDTLADKDLDSAWELGNYQDDPWNIHGEHVLVQDMFTSLYETESATDWKYSELDQWPAFRKAYVRAVDPNRDTVDERGRHSLPGTNADWQFIRDLMENGNK